MLEIYVGIIHFACFRRWVGCCVRHAVARLLVILLYIFVALADGCLISLFFAFFRFRHSALPIRSFGPPQDDIFGVVPFLLAKEGTIPKSGLTFTAKDPISVVFSIDTVALKVLVYFYGVFNLI